MASLIVQKLDTTDVELGDLGITIQGGTAFEYDLMKSVDVDNIAQSSDLISAVNEGLLIILDPRDGTTVLSTADSILCIEQQNSTHFGVVGGRFGALDDPGYATTSSNLVEISNTTAAAETTFADVLATSEGTAAVNASVSSPASDIAAGSTLGLQQLLLSDAGQVGLTVLAVGYTNTGKVQGISLGDGNVIEVYASGTDYNAGVVLYREFMSLGEPICFTGVSNGAIITSTQGFYGVSEQVDGNLEGPMPLLSYGLSFKSTFLYAFRASSEFQGTANRGFIHVVNGPLASILELTTGTGTVVENQSGIELLPWEHYTLETNANIEYVISSTNPVMACIHAGMVDIDGLTGSNGFYDSRLIMPLTNDGITWPRFGNISAPYDNTQVDYYVRDGASGRINSTLGTGVSPGAPVDFDANDGIGTGANDADYEPAGATRIRAIGLVTAYSGADSSGGEATPLMPVSAMSQVIAQPLYIADVGDGGNSGVAIASTSVGTAKVYEWNATTLSLDLAYTVALTRSITTITTKTDQYHPTAALIANETTATELLVGQLNPGVIIADVPITVVVQNGTQSLGPSQTLRSQNGTTTTGIGDDDDETLVLGWIPPTSRAEIREGTDGLTYRRIIDAGVESWVLT